MPRTTKYRYDRAFTWDDHRGPFCTITADQAARYDRDGYFLWKGALAPEAVAGLRAAIDPLEARIAEWARDQVASSGEMQVSRPDELSFAEHLAAVNPVVRAFTMTPALVGLAVDLLGPDVRVYQEHAVYKKPETAQSLPWHQDAAYEFTEPEHYLTCWIPLTRATVDNGCVSVLPRAHRGGILEHRRSPVGYVCLDDGGGVPVEAEVGDVLVFSSLTPHRSGPNLTQDTRKAYIVHYCVDGTRWLDGEQLDGFSSAVCDDPKRQYLVAVGGKPVVPA